MNHTPKHAATSHRAHEVGDDHVYRRRRIGVAAGATVMAGLAYFGLVKPTVDRMNGPEVPKFDTEYIVHSGDTAWDIARLTMPGEDPRPMSEQITAEDPDLQPGDSIMVPHQFIENLQAQEQQRQK